MEKVIPIMTPAAGSRLRRFVGDTVRFELRTNARAGSLSGWRAMLRTNLGRAAALRQEILRAHTTGVAPAGESWRDVPMRVAGSCQGSGEVSHSQEAPSHSVAGARESWFIDLPITEVGYFQAKAYLLDSQGWQHWVEGPDTGISVHPNRYRSGNTIYCAWPRLFGTTRSSLSTVDPKLEQSLASLDTAGYSVLPPSGKLRDLTAQLPHIVDRLGCKILHLLPVNPTPTTYARFGRFGSPYAVLDLTAIDPALVVFDKATTGVDQFRELTYAVHKRGARVFLDIVINHTGWGSVLQETHPEWFLRNGDGTFASPGAWGTTWEDLVELKHVNVALWDELAEIFLIWCRRGVDGFRCDAGYKVPVPAWQYIIARVQEEFPETLFLLEGLGGSWESTEALLTEGGMQWAYSELFQNYSAQEVSGYLGHSLEKSEQAGLLVNYSETHDNDRLARRGREWSLLRNRLCALTSVSGGFGFTCGVEWLATEKIKVHGCTGLAWDARENIVPELAKLNQLLSDHPCFFDGANVSRLSAANSPVLVLKREAPAASMTSDQEASDEILILANLDLEKPHEPAWEPGKRPSQGSDWTDLLTEEPQVHVPGSTVQNLTVKPGSVLCLSRHPRPLGLAGPEYRRRQMVRAWALQSAAAVLPHGVIGGIDPGKLGDLAQRDHVGYLAVLMAVVSRHEAATQGSDAQVGPDRRPGRTVAGKGDLAGALDAAETPYPAVIRWELRDRNRVTLVPPNHWLLIEDSTPFRVTFCPGGPAVKSWVGRAVPCAPAVAPAAKSLTVNLESVEILSGLHVACFPPAGDADEAAITIERYADRDRQVEARVRFLPPLAVAAKTAPPSPQPEDLVLLTNSRGGMARLCVDFGRINSKYDCVLGANLHPELPVDRHVLVKRVRLWVNADGFISPLDFRSLANFDPGPPAGWKFVANAGDGRTVEIQVSAMMLANRNTTLLHFCRPVAAEAWAAAVQVGHAVPCAPVSGSSPPHACGRQLPATADVRLTVRVDLEDRGFHGETRRNGGAEHHFTTHTRPLPGSDGKVGFAFSPAADRHLKVYANSGAYHPAPEWSDGIPHPVEQSRGQQGSGDAYSPGWFDLPLPNGAALDLVLTADPQDPSKDDCDRGRARSPSGPSVVPKRIERLGEESLPHNLSRGGAPPAWRRDIPAAPGESEMLVADETSLERRLDRAARAFVVKRGAGKTVIAGYPWFLDWGRDTFIAARGLLAAGMVDEVRQILMTFAQFEDRGTLPNTIFGSDASNRDTTDAPLWFAVVCEELAALESSGAPGLATRPPNERPSLYDATVGSTGRTMRDVLVSIATHYLQGTPNGIRVDPASGLVFSPAHFTWMDTNYPAGTPREGYPVEIQALWIRLLRHLHAIGAPAGATSWDSLAEETLATVISMFWLEDRGWFSDVLLARPGQPAKAAVMDDALRSNCCFLVSLGLVGGLKAQRCVEAVRRHLVVPGALRSLAPLPVSVPLPVPGANGQLLNNPHQPYWGRYEGDEDTRRKPAYHNGTAWTWTFPVFCEALARAWDHAPAARAAAGAYLGSMAELLDSGCLGQLPEIIDGDAPHTQRGCDAQAWSATEALRVLKLLQGQ